MPRTSSALNKPTKDGGIHTGDLPMHTGARLFGNFSQFPKTYWLLDHSLTRLLLSPLVSLQI
ncbi:Uncharacterized protein DAT39_000154 [Clarias magur]|uniref:Uncharacterized protein n=1 Tax=Clarias magur TaxID=1594786 RepID=A0A8J5C9G8_CLAMG|nr:Uncharacterized protein DAT39_000154 [Clarias magur]